MTAHLDHLLPLLMVNGIQINTLYSPNCGQQQLTFDGYISYLITLEQQYSAQYTTDIICNGQPEGWCDLSTLMTPMIQMQIQFMQFNIYYFCS